MVRLRLANVASGAWLICDLFRPCCPIDYTGIAPHSRLNRLPKSPAAVKSLPALTVTLFAPVWLPAVSFVLKGTINQLASFAYTPVIGDLAMLALALILLRLMPQGITGRFFRNST